jgi:DNA primase
MHERVQHLPLGDFTMDAENELNNQPAVASDVGAVVPNNSSTLYQSILAEPLLTTVLCYATCLLTAVKTLAYLKQNCLLTDEVLRIGFSDRTLGAQLPSPRSKPGQALRTQLQTVGILKDSGHETFRGMVTVPLLSTNGTVTGIYGRRIDRHALGETETTIGSGIFNGTALKNLEEIIVTDNILDAWTFYSAGYTNVICPVGYTLQIADLLNVKRVLLASESTDCEAFTNCEIFHLKFPTGQSAHQYQLAQRGAGNSDPLGAVIRAAGWQRGVCFQLAIEQPTAPESVNSSTPAIAEEEETNSQSRSLCYASPVPIKLDDLQVTMTAEDLTITTEWRRYRIRGLERNALPGVMKVNLLIYNERTDRFHVDNFDLYHARSRRTFTMEAADEIGASESQLRSDLGRVLLKLEQLQAEQKQLSKANSKPKPLNETERAEAMELLQSENLLDRILDDFDACGIVGERTGKLVGYLAATSRLLAKPLGLIIQSSSAAGKSSLMNAILGFMPPEHQFTCSAMTGQSLYYAANVDLRHKILSIAEESGVRDASYALKLLQSEGHLAIVTTGKERGSGRTAVERHEVAGPVALMLTTSESDVDPELMNRCFVLGVDEESAQTAAIQQRQRDGETLSAFLACDSAERIRSVHRNAQRLLRPLEVFNPYGSQLGFTSQRVRNRRDQTKYLSLIRAIAFLHQFSREVKQVMRAGKVNEYIEVTSRDIAIANTLTDSVLGTSIDELPQQSRKLLRELYHYVREQAAAQQANESEIRFTRREIRERLGWGATVLRVHLERLCRWEYVVPQSSGRGALAKYQLLFNGRGYEGQPTFCGLVDASKLT